MKSKSFDPRRDVPALTGKVILITGGNVGIGKQTALDLTRHSSSQIWIAARNRQKSQAAADEIKSIAPDVAVHVLELDLGSFDSIKSAARTFLASAPRLDILLLNSGVMGGEPALTKDGYEITFGINHVGHALFTKLLTLLLIQTSEIKGSDVRVVVLSSRGHTVVSGIDFDSLKKKESNVNIINRYAQSKLASLLWARAMAKHHPEFTTVSIHPGDVKTGLFSQGGYEWYMNFIVTFLGPLFQTTVEEGAKNSSWAASSPAVQNGGYYLPVGVPALGNKAAQDDNLMEKLWSWTEKELQGQKL